MPLIDVVCIEWFYSKGKRVCLSHKTMWRVNKQDDDACCKVCYKECGEKLT